MRTTFTTIVHNQTIATADGMSVLRHDNPEGEPCGPFWGFCENCVATVVTGFESDRDLEAIYTSLQNGIGSRNPERTRSLSVGDVIVFHSDPFGGHPKEEAFVVAPTGFRPVALKTVRTALDNEVPEGFEAV